MRLLIRFNSNPGILKLRQFMITIVNMVALIIPVYQTIFTDGLNVKLKKLLNRTLLL